MEDKDKKFPADFSADNQNETTANDAEIEEELAREIEREDNGEQNRTAAVPAVPAAAAAAPAKRGAGVWMIVSAVLAAALVFVLIKPPFAAGDGASVATVNGEDITKEQLYDKLIEAGGEPTLDNMITEMLVAQEVKKANVTVSDEEVTKSVELLIASFPSQAEFENALAGAGMTEDDLKESTKQRLEMAKLLGDKAAVTDDEIKTFFEQNKAQFETPEQVSASHILVATKEEAEAVKKELEGGADFATLAKEKSTEPAAQQTGGDLGYFGRGQMDPAFEEAAFTQKVGDLGVVQSSFGFHVLKVTDHKEAVASTLEEKQDVIREQLIAQKVGENSQTYLEELKAKATISNTLTADAEEPAAGNTETSVPANQ